MAHPSSMLSAETAVIADLGDGLTIRPFRHSDIPAAMEYLNNLEVRKYLRNVIPYPYTQADAEWWVNHTSNKTATWIQTGPWSESSTKDASADVQRLVPTQYCIALDDKLIGAIGLAMKSDIYFRCGEVGYWLAQPYWGKGIMGKAAKAFVDWIFETLGVVWRVEAGIYAGNIGSRKCLLRAGLVYEGVRKGFIWKRGGSIDEVLFGRVREKELWT